MRRSTTGARVLLGREILRKLRQEGGAIFVEERRRPRYVLGLHLELHPTHSV
jgi:hypothetical protein